MSLALLIAATLAQTPLTDAAPPADVRPARVAAAGVYVADLERAKAWYVSMLGMTVRQAVPKYGEYILVFGAGSEAATIVLQRSDKRPPGVNLNSRLVVLTPNAKGMAAWLKTRGVVSREAVADVAYFVFDPEGNPIELYTPPKP